MIKELYKKARLIAIQEIDIYKNTPIYLILKQRQEFCMMYIDGKIQEKDFIEYLKLQEDILKKEFTI